MNTNLTTKKKIFFVDGLINKSASQTFTFIEKISKEKENFEISIKAVKELFEAAIKIDPSLAK